MQVLSLGIIFFTISTIDQSIVSGIGQPKKVTNILLIGAAFNLITNLFFIPIWGMNAAAVTTTLSYILIQVLTSSALKKYIKVKMNIKTWIETFFVAFVFVLTIYIVKALLKINPYLEVLICLAASTLIYFVLCHHLGMINMKEIKKFVLVLLNKRNQNGKTI